MENYDLIVGKSYLFRTVTMIYAGVFVAELPDRYILKEASWIADTGRWAENLVSCDFNEVEIYPPEKYVHVYRSGMLDHVEIDRHPKDTK